LRLAKNHQLSLIIFISIIFMITTVQQPSFQSTVDTSSLTVLPRDEDSGDNEQGSKNHTNTALGNKVELLLLINSTSHNATRPVELLLNYSGCIDEGAIYIHGVWTPREEAIEQAERTNTSIEQAKNNLSLPTDKKLPIFIFIWKGNTELSESGWLDAKSNTIAAGHELAEIIAKSKDVCPDDKIRIIAHSLGSRVVLSALDSLENNNTRWKEGGHNLTSVHIMGAAADHEKVSKNQSDIDDSSFDDGKVYGIAIERNVVNFTNLYNPEDDMLERVNETEQKTDHNQMDVYPLYEKDDALGWRGNASIDKVDLPSNYNETNVQNEILAIKDADAGAIIEAPFPACDVFKYNSISKSFDCTISHTIRGDNHKGYIGFRDPNDHSRLISDEGDGAIDVVVSDWWLN
jgi:hypothetical protein